MLAVQCVHATNCCLICECMVKYIYASVNWTIIGIVYTLSNKPRATNLRKISIQKEIKNQEDFRLQFTTFCCGNMLAKIFQGADIYKNKLLMNTMINGAAYNTYHIWHDEILS